MLEMKTISKSYNCEYRRVFWINTWTHYYELVGRWGAVHLHVRDYENSDKRIEHCAGLEYHYRQPPEYMKDKAPTHNKCHLLNGPCWHDGTSLYATEHYLPIHLQGDIERVFVHLAHDADEKFKEYFEGSGDGS